MSTITIFLRSGAQLVLGNADDVPLEEWRDKMTGSVGCVALTTSRGTLVTRWTDIVALFLDEPHRAPDGNL